MKLQWLALLLLVIQVNTHMRPTYYIVGLARQCAYYAPVVPTSWVCLKIGGDTVNELEIQAGHACSHLDTLTQSMRTHSLGFGFNLVGFDQGGLIARLVLQTCDPVKRFVKRLFTFGTPHIGTTEVANLVYRGDKKTAGNYFAEVIGGVGQWIDKGLSTCAYDQYNKGKKSSTNFLDRLYGDKPKSKREAQTRGKQISQTIMEGLS